MDPKVVTKVTKTWEASLNPDGNSSILFSGRSDSDCVTIRARRSSGSGYMDEGRSDDAFVNLTGEQFVAILSEVCGKLGYVLMERPGGKKDT